MTLRGLSLSIASIVHVLGDQHSADKVDYLAILKSGHSVKRKSQASLFSRL